MSSAAQEYWFYVEDHVVCTVEANVGGDIAQLKHQALKELDAGALSCDPHLLPVMRTLIEAASVRHANV